GRRGRASRRRRSATHRPHGVPPLRDCSTHGQDRPPSYRAKPVFRVAVKTLPGLAAVPPWFARFLLQRKGTCASGTKTGPSNSAGVDIASSPVHRRNRARPTGGVLHRRTFPARGARSLLFGYSEH